MADKPLLESDLESSKAPSAGASSWAERVAGSASSKSGMKLRFIKPMVEDSKTIVTPPQEVEEECAKKWENCLIGYFLDSKIPFAVVRNIALKIWGKHNLMDVLPVGKGFSYSSSPNLMVQRKF